MMREYQADLHIHTLLSACAEVEMIPPLIVEEALLKGLDVIAVTDHNTVGNCAAVMEAARGTDLAVLPGMELLTREEVDVLCLFGTLEQAWVWQSQVDAWLLPLENDPETFGPQFLVDAEGEYVADDTVMRKSPAMVGIEEAARRVHALGGLVIPAHIERTTYGLMHVLGVWSPELEADAVEVSHNMRPREAAARYPSLPDIPVITNSDAHFLDWIGMVRSIFVLEDAPSIQEVQLAFQGKNDRRVYVP